jgi:PIN domain nuclease of toxin-antitoxin system
VILLDTHIWIWWVHRDTQLPAKCRQLIEAHISTGIGVSVISCWEVAMLVQYGRLDLAAPVAEWVTASLAYPGVKLVELSTEIAIGATLLPSPFHRDPADRWLVASARVLGMKLVTLDRRILDYPHVPLAQF